MNSKKDLEKLDIIHKNLYNIFGKVIEFLEDNNIEYFIQGGTLLGSVRDKKIIDHDDDIDIGVVGNDFEKNERINK